MTSTAPSRDGNGGQDGGIGMSRRPADLDEIRGAVDKVAAAQSERERHLADVRHSFDITGDGGDDMTMAGVLAATNAAAAQDLDDLLRTLRGNGIGTPPTSRDLDAPVDPAARSAADRWADAGYTTPAAVADWTTIGIDTPEIARQWGEAGFTAESAARWVQVPDMTPTEAATCAHGGMTPTDVQRIRRADPVWVRPEPGSPAPEPGYGIEL
jgi:hypothetical protein